MTRIADPFLRNVAIIAHVDHGKTTLVDALLQHSGTLQTEGAAQRVLDHNPIERERGITIFSKNCAVDYHYRAQEPAGADTASSPEAGTYRINIIDTPGHADFGGEVERVLRMADGALLLVDAFEGPMPQTRFVLSKALELKLRPIVVINKCDRPEARPDAVLNEVFDLLVELGADDQTLDFTTVYTCGRDGWATLDHDAAVTGELAEGGTMNDLFNVIIQQVPSPHGDPDAPLQMLITTLGFSEYVGRIAIGRVFAGTIKPGQPVALCRKDGSVLRSKAARVLRFNGLGREEAAQITAGDLCAVEGLSDFDIGDTIADANHPVPMPRVAVDEPTLHMTFRINDSPFAGREGKYVTSRQISERLDRELLSNVALRVEPGETADEFRVSGRGLLHLGVLLENMRREGFELSVGPPKVIEKIIDEVRCEPVESLSLDIAADNMGPAIELLGQRGADIQSVENGGQRVHIQCEIPARSLIGLRSRMLTATGGEAVMHHTFSHYAPVRSISRKRANGVLIATETGQATTYALLNLADRGVMFIQPQKQVYEGQIVGEHTRDKDLPVNVVRAKAFSNVRESTKDATVTLKAPRLLTLEAALEYIEDDELVELTPSSIRLRKRLLKEADRRRSERQRAALAEKN